MGKDEEKLNSAASPAEADTSVGTAEDVEAVMKKYDRESNTRIWEGTPKLLVRGLAIAFSLYCIWVTLFSTAMPEIKLNIFLGLILIMGYLNYPIRKGTAKVNSLPWYDIIIMLAGAIPFFYFAANATPIIKMATRVTKDQKMVIMAVGGAVWPQDKGSKQWKTIIQ